MSIDSALPPIGDIAKARDHLFASSQEAAKAELDRGVMPADALAGFVRSNLSYLLRRTGVGEAVDADEVARKEALRTLEAATERAMDAADADLGEARIPILQYIALTQKPGRQKVDLYGVSRAVPKQPEETGTEKLSRVQDIYGWLVNPEAFPLPGESEQAAVRRLWVLADYAITTARFSDATVTEHVVFNGSIGDGTRYAPPIELAATPALTLTELSDELLQIAADTIEQQP